MSERVLSSDTQARLRLLLARSGPDSDSARQMGYKKKSTSNLWQTSKTPRAVKSSYAQAATQAAAAQQRQYAQDDQLDSGQLTPMSVNSAISAQSAPDADQVQTIWKERFEDLNRRYNELKAITSVDQELQTELEKQLDVTRSHLDDARTKEAALRAQLQAAQDAAFLAERDKIEAEKRALEREELARRHLQAEAELVLATRSMQKALEKADGTQAPDKRGCEACSIM